MLDPLTFFFIVLLSVGAGAAIAGDTNVTVEQEQAYVEENLD